MGLRLKGEPGGRVRRGGGGGRRGGEETGASSPVSDAGRGVLQAGEAWLRRRQEAVVFLVLLVFLLQVGAGAELAELEGEALAAAVGQGGRRAGVVLPQTWGSEI